MDLSVDQSIKVAELAYADAAQHVTDVALEVESKCSHSVWCGRDCTSSSDGIYICLNCRMEIHIPRGYLLSSQNGPEGSMILSEKQCKVSTVLTLRVNGDRRGFLTYNHGFLTKWPKRLVPVNVL